MSPNLLAVGLYNGVTLIYNVARESSTVAIDSYDSPGKHGGPVWHLEWVERERGGDERGEGKVLKIFILLRSTVRKTRFKLILSFSLVPTVVDGRFFI